MGLGYPRDLQEAFGTGSRYPVRCSNGPCAEMSRGTHHERPWPCLKLFTELQLAGHCDVALGVGFIEIIEQTTTLANHLEQATAGAVVFVVFLQVLCEMVNSLGEQSNLNVRTAGITVMHPKLFNCFVLKFHTVRFQSKRIRLNYVFRVFL